VFVVVGFVGVRPGSAAPSPPTTRAPVRKPRRVVNNNDDDDEDVELDHEEDVLVQYRRDAKLRQIFGASVPHLTQPPPPVPPLPADALHSAPPRLSPLPPLSLPLAELNNNRLSTALDSARTSTNNTPRSARRAASLASIQLPPIDPHRLQPEVSTAFYSFCDCQLYYSNLAPITTGCVVVASNGDACLCQSASVLEGGWRASACRHATRSGRCQLAQRSARRRCRRTCTPLLLQHRLFSPMIVECFTFGV
jgi:hypothetical protein